MPCRFLIIFLIFLSSLVAQDYYCKKERKISLIKFFLKDEKNQNEYEYLKSGISRLLYSFLRTQFFISSEFHPEMVINLNPSNIQCNKYILAKIYLNLDKEFKIFDFDDNLKTQLHNIILTMNSDSLITGSIHINQKILEIDIYYFNITNNQLIQKKVTLTSDNPYSEENILKLKNIANELFMQMIQSNKQKIKITSNLEDYYVYINDISYGKNIKEIFLPEGNFKISIYHSYCNKDFDSTQNNIIFNCSNQILKKIYINSLPSNSDVFVDDRFFGKTPLTIELPIRIYRIRISKLGFIDKNIMIDLKKNEISEIYTELSSGDNDEHYYKRHYAISNWTYYDLSFGFAVQSLFFAGGWAYANIQKEKVLDSIRSPIIPNYYLNPLEITLIQYSIIENARRKSIYWHRQSQIYGSLGLLSLVTSAYCLYKGIKIDLERGYEIGANNIKIYFDWQF
jgi:hypothetical protein